MLRELDWRSVQHGLARVWPHCWGPNVQDGDMMSRGGALQWNCPWCQYSLGFWPKDRFCAESTAQSHLLQAHERELGSMVLSGWHLPG